MQSSSLIQLSLIILGLIAAITGVQVLMEGFFGILIFGLGTASEYVTQNAILTLLSTGMHFLIAWFLISNSKDWTRRLVNFTRVDPNFSIIANPAQILFFLFVCIGVYSLIKEFPVLLQKLYVEFSTRVARISREETFYQTKLPDWPAVVLLNLFPVLLILFARQLSNYFASKMTEESIIEIKEGPEMNNN